MRITLYVAVLACGVLASCGGSSTSTSSRSPTVASAITTTTAPPPKPPAPKHRVDYYEVPNSRLVYRSRGNVSSFGIASMISWRGVWYVVHLGAVTRSGIVDDPSSGPGTPAPSSTC